MSRYDDNVSRGRSRQERNDSPDYAYAGGSAGVPYPPSDEPFMSGGSGPRIPSPGHTSYPAPPAPTPPASSQARLTYEPQSPFYPQPNSALQIPYKSSARPRSLPPPVGWRRGPSRYEDDHDDRDRDRGRHHGHRDRSPISKAKDAFKDTFTDSTTGLGVGVLGAIVGGLAAHEASEATSRNSHDSETQRRNQLLSTMVGAAVGALGANAVEKRIEVTRERDREKQGKWEQKWASGKRPNSRGSLTYMDERRVGRGADIIERREIITRPRSGSSGRGGWKREWDVDDRRGKRGMERVLDPDAKSWRNVEDWVYDEKGRESSRGRRGDYRY